jgi:hypothetical protein
MFASTDIFTLRDYAQANSFRNRQIEPSESDILADLGSSDWDAVSDTIARSIHDEELDILRAAAAEAWQNETEAWYADRPVQYRNDR